MQKKTMQGYISRDIHIEKCPGFFLPAVSLSISSDASVFDFPLYILFLD
jgi:hypothetical protein